MRSFDPVLAGLIASERRAVGRLLVAPVAARGRVRVDIGGMAWMGRPPQGYSGWGVFRIETDRKLTLVREAGAADIERYALQHRRGRAVLVGLPGVVHDFRAAVFEVELCPALEPFDTVEYIDDGATCWYVETGRTDAWSQELQAARRTGRGPDPRWTERQAQLYELSRTFDTRSGLLEGRLRRALGVAGARLDAFQEGNAGQVQVRWTRYGSTFNTTVRGDSLQVVSSGICLSGRDSDFDMTSIVPVMEEGRGGATWHEWWSAVQARWVGSFANIWPAWEGSNYRW
ncbi:MAG TPA: hypothetical protein VGO93_12215 [Candidatus Xenobia bacterium]|jgi:hypothetical protein